MNKFETMDNMNTNFVALTDQELMSMDGGAIEWVVAAKIAGYIVGGLAGGGVIAWGFFGKQLSIKRGIIMEIQSLKFEQLLETELTNIDGGVAPALIAFGVAAAKGFGGTVAVAGGVMTLHSFGRFLSGRQKR